jgi:predicted HicB family RNase H-like nuclease
MVWSEESRVTARGFTLHFWSDRLGAGRGNEYTTRGNVNRPGPRPRPARREVALRLSPRLHEALQQASEESGTYNLNSYISTVIELTILDTDRNGLGPIELVDAILPSEQRIHVAIRIAPSLFDRLGAEAKKCNVSVNAFAAWSIARVLLT